MYNCEICLGKIEEGDKVMIGYLTSWPPKQTHKFVYVAHARCEGYGTD